MVLSYEKGRGRKCTVVPINQEVLLSTIYDEIFFQNLLMPNAAAEIVLDLTPGVASKNFHVASPRNDPLEFYRRVPLLWPPQFSSDNTFNIIFASPCRPQKGEINLSCPAIVFTPSVHK
jgi:hypothetical protein